MTPSSQRMEPPLYPGRFNVLGVAEVGVGLGVAGRVAADLGGLVALGQGGQDRLAEGGGELQAGSLDGGVEGLLEGAAVAVEGRAEVGEQVEELLLAVAA